MLSLRAEDRPTVKKVQNELRKIKEGRMAEPSKTVTGKVRIGLRGKLVAKDSGEPKKALSASPSDTTRPAKVSLRGKGLNNADK